MHDAKMNAATLRDSLKDWALNRAFPLWWDRGYDHEQGGFHEKLALDGNPVSAPRRARVQPRQIYCYTVASSMGWDGPAEKIIRLGLDLYQTRYRRPDGLFRTLVSAGGEVLDNNVTLYDQAFALLALATAGEALGVVEQHEQQALALLAALHTELRHPVAGFLEPGGDHRQQSNPHMHLFEAAQAWEQVGSAPAWAALVDEIADMALTRFIDPVSGGLREFFDAQWQPAAGTDGRIVEPGHQFEWAWLLMRWGQRRNHSGAIKAALRLVEIGERHGVDPARNVACNSLLDDFSIHDNSARLWPQTERIKAGALAAEITGEADYWRIATDGATGLLRYLDTTVPGLWFDRMQADGALVEEPSPASSFYHIVCAIAELDRALGQ